jgi:hypothetical protein
MNEEAMAHWGGGAVVPKERKTPVYRLDNILHDSSQYCPEIYPKRFIFL